VKFHPALVGAAALAVTAVCLAAGFWQLSRLHTKQALNAATRAALAAAPETLGTSPGAIARQAGRKVVAAGEYDEGYHVLLSARFHDADLGVEVLTPLRTAGGLALLVNRGWMHADDGQNAAPESLPEPGARRVVGMLEPLARRDGMPSWRALAGPAAVHWSTHELDSASVAAHAPYALAPAVLVALPDTAASAGFTRTGPPLLDEQVHVSYAFQWFAFAFVTVVGTLAIALRRRSPRPEGPGRTA
jgi:surfeit locus 1 family protein